MRLIYLAAVPLALFVAAPASAQLTIKSINEAQYPVKRSAKVGPNQIVKAQILLDRARFSPGAIDGKNGENFRQAIAAFKQAKGLKGPARIDKEFWEALDQEYSEGVLVTYAITEEDVRGPYEPNLPKEFEKLADVKKPAYVDVREMLAERHHMSEELLDKLNPKKKFDQVGTEIVVPNVSSEGFKSRDVARLEVDKIKLEMRAFDKDGQLLAFYPASVGSSDRPAPSGELTIRTVVTDPNYTYNPKYKFREDLTKTFLIQPGPNNPVGTVWIALSRGDGYGIHGTPDPTKVGKSFSHGCVRLTNWDARELASAVKRGVRVAFLADGKPTTEADEAAPEAEEAQPKPRRVAERRKSRRRR